MLWGACTKAPPEGSVATPEAQFWAWFSANEVPLADAAGTNDPVPVMEGITAQVQRVKPGLAAEIAVEVGPKKTQGLVITADGKRSLFPDVKRLVAAAPRLTRWTTFAFRQRRDPKLRIEMADRVFTVDDYWFRVTRQGGGTADLEVLVKGLSAANKDAVTSGAFLLLDVVLGEYDTETKLGAVHVLPLPQSFGAEVRPLVQLPSIVDRL